MIGHYRSTGTNELDRFVQKHYKKDEGAIKHDYHPKAAIDVASCYCIKEEYLTKLVNSEHYVGIEQFDLVAATADLPNEEQQETLLTTKSERPINSVWISYVAKWKECEPNDRTIESAYRWYNWSIINNVM